MSVTDIDLQAHSQGRIAGLLALSARFRAVMTAIVAGFTEVKTAIRSVDTVLDLDNQSGVVLDLIGALVGQPRRLNSGNPRIFFADDTSYKFAIRARIVKNITKADGVTPWIERIYQVLLTIITDANTYPPEGPVSYNFPLWAIDRRMTITICIGRAVTEHEAALLTQADLLPIPDGVRLLFTQWNDEAPVMGFIGQTGANVSGYGDRKYPSRGGRLAERIHPHGNP